MEQFNLITMKKTLLLSIALVLTGLSSFAQWEPQFSGTSNWIAGICYTSADIGYAASDGGITEAGPSARGPG